MIKNVDSKVDDEIIKVDMIVLLGCVVCGGGRVGFGTLTVGDG